MPSAQCRDTKGGLKCHQGWARGYLPRGREGSLGLNGQAGPRSETREWFLTVVLLWIPESGCSTYWLQTMGKWHFFSKPPLSISTQGRRPWGEMHQAGKALARCLAHPQCS